MRGQLSCLCFHVKACIISKSLYNVIQYSHCIYTRNTRSPLCNWQDQTSVKCFRRGKDERATVRLIVKYDGMLGNVSFDFQPKIMLRLWRRRTHIMVLFQQSVYTRKMISLGLHFMRLSRELWFFIFTASWFVATATPIQTCSWGDIEKP